MLTERRLSFYSTIWQISLHLKEKTFEGSQFLHYLTLVAARVTQQLSVNEAVHAVVKQYTVQFVVVPTRWGTFFTVFALQITEPIQILISITSQHYAQQNG